MYFGARGNCILRSSSSTSGGARCSGDKEGRGRGEGRRASTHDRATLLKKWIKFKPPLSLCLFRSIFDPPLLLSLLSFVPPRHFCQPTFSLLLLFFFFSLSILKQSTQKPFEWSIVETGGKERRGWTRAHAGKMKTNQAETSLPGNNRRPLPPDRELCLPGRYVTEFSFWEEPIFTHGRRVSPDAPREERGLDAAAKMFRDDECSDEGNDRSIRLENFWCL